MKKLYLAALLLFILQNGFTQTPQWQWVQSGGGDGSPNATPQSPVPDKIWSSALDKDGNLIVGGEISWYPDFDTIHFGSNVNWQTPNWFLAKYDKCGNILWARVGGGDGADYVAGVDVDERGNIYTYTSMFAQGAPGYINTPAKDTALTNSMFFIGKFDPDGNLLYVRSYNSPLLAPIFPTRGMFKRLKNGNLLTVTQLNSDLSNATVGNFQLVTPYSRNFILYDSLGNEIKGALIDTIGSTGSYLNPFVVDENENIYFSIVNLGLSTVSFLSHVYNVARYTTYFYKTDTSFTIKAENTSGYYRAALNYYSYSNGYLYGSARNPNGAIFDGDTTHTTNLNGVFTVYKMDTNLHKVWVSRPSYMQYDPTNTYIYPAASKDYMYVSFMGTGSYIWNGDTLSTTPIYQTPSFFQLRTSDGVCVSSSKGVRGNTTSSHDAVEKVVCDASGNLLMMGEFTNWCGIPTDSVYANGTNASPDYFILKWGLNCSDSLNSLDKPDAPTNLVATASGTHSIDVSWSNNSPYHAGFHLYRSLDSVGNYVQIDSTDANVYTYADTNVIPNTIYWYKVAAYTAGGESGFSNKDSAEILQQTQCNTPLTVTITSASTGLCPGDSTQICVQGSYTSYLWNNAQTSACIYPRQAGDYYVTATDANGCTGVSNHLPVTVYPAPTAQILPSHDTLFASHGVMYQWYHNGIVTGDTSQFFTDIQGGSYWVLITDSNGCTATSQPFIVGGANNLSANSAVNIYPNPSSSAWQLEVSDNFLGSEAEITDAAGKLVYRFTVNRLKSELKFEAAKSIYFINIKNPLETWSGKILKD